MRRFGLLATLLLALRWAAAAQNGWEAQLSPYEAQNLAKNRHFIAARRARGENPQARVGVFLDAGVWNLGATSLIQCLERSGVSCRVLGHNDLDQLQSLSALILPGGLSYVELQGLGLSGAEKVRAFVNGGGHCLGICAGGYLVSQTVRYKGINYPYPLGLFDGVADGPVAGLADYPEAGPVSLTVTRAGAARGLASVADRAFLYGGGPRFVGGTGVTVLLQYADGTPAAISREVGRGEVCATGFHMERPAPADGDENSPPPAGCEKLIKALLGLR